MSGPNGAALPDELQTLSARLAVVEQTQRTERDNATELLAKVRDLWDSRILDREIMAALHTKLDKLLLSKRRK